MHALGLVDRPRLVDIDGVKEIASLRGLAADFFASSIIDVCECCSHDGGPAPVYGRARIDGEGHGSGNGLPRLARAQPGTALALTGGNAREGCTL